MKIFNTAVFLLLVSNLMPAQNGFEDWDKNYSHQTIENIIQSEIDYSKAVEKDTTQNHYYVALNKFRFIAKFTGNRRKANPENLDSMKRVFKIKTGNNNVLNDLVSEEFEFSTEKSKVWLLIQKQLVVPFLNEVGKEEDVLLYCLFTNEHHFKGGITNSFLISEFTTDWD